MSSYSKSPGKDSPILSMSLWEHQMIFQVPSPRFQQCGQILQQACEQPSLLSDKLLHLCPRHLSPHWDPQPRQDACRYPHHVCKYANSDLDQMD